MTGWWHRHRGRPDELRASDRPIAGRADDLLGRRVFAEAMAERIANVPGDTSTAVAISGPHGGGGTSILNMTIETLRDDHQHTTVLRFNPFLFAADDDLVQRFFDEIGRQLAEHDHHLAALGAQVMVVGAGLGGAVAGLPISAPLVAALRDATRRDHGDAPAAEADSVAVRRAKLTAALAEHPGSIVVAIDDVDRLSEARAVEMLRLIELIGNFPHLVYLVVVNREWASDLLGGGRTGEERYRRIFQVTHEIPPLSPARLTDLLAEGIQHAIDGRDTGPFDPERWHELFVAVVRPLFSTPSDARQYLKALPVTLGVVGSDVALEDVLALEAVRRLVPSVFAALPAASRPLTLGATGRESRSAVTELMALAGPHQAAVQSMCELLFPASLVDGKADADQLDAAHRARRVACPVVLNGYLHHTLHEDFAVERVVEQFYAAIGRREQLEAVLAELAPDELQATLEQVEADPRGYPADAVGPAIEVALAQCTRLPEERARLFAVDADLKLGRLLGDLLVTLGTEEERETVVRDALAAVPQLSARAVLLGVVAEPEPLVSAPALAALETDLAHDLLEASPAKLAGERQLCALLELAGRRGVPSAALRDVCAEQEVLLQALRTALVASIDPPLDDPRVGPRDLRWAALTVLGRTELAELVLALPDGASDDDRTVAAVLLARHHAVATTG